MLKYKIKKMNLIDLLFNDIDLQQMQKGSFIMIKTLIIESGQKPMEEQLKEVEEAKRSPINFDEDCEELSPTMMKAFKSAVVQRNRKKKA